MCGFDDFYPVSRTMQEAPHGLWQIGMACKIASHLANARRGDRLSESKLINRIGQLRRCVDHFDNLGLVLQDVVKESIAWIRTTGRTVNFSADDPRYWVTARDGKSPRW